MPTMEVTQSIEFECGYVDENINGKPTIEFHRYKVSVSVCSMGDTSNSRLIDFESLKLILKRNLPSGMIFRVDHASDFENILLNAFKLSNNVFYTYNVLHICAETLASRIGTNINADLASCGLKVSKLVLKENTNSSVVWAGN